MSSTAACPRTVRLRLVEVQEVGPPEGAEPPACTWRLLTTHDIADAAEAWRIVDWYQARWTIEQLFRVMKSQGLQLEDSQLGSAERLVKLAAVATKAACVDIQLTQERDGKHQVPAANVFTEPEIETLAALGPTLEGKTERQQNQHPVRSLAWAAWIIARLGGWNCYYKPPGPITFRRGMEQFYAIHRGRQLEMRLQRRVDRRGDRLGRVEQARGGRELAIRFLEVLPSRAASSAQRVSMRPTACRNPALRPYALHSQFHARFANPTPHGEPRRPPSCSGRAAWR